MNVPAADVEAIVQAAGHGTRLGLGPKAFIVLAGRTLLERAVTTMLTTAARVSVAVPAADLARAEELVGGSAVRVIVGGMRRTDTLRALVGTATAPWLLLHDVVHPFVTPELSRRVMEQARRSGAAAATLPNANFLYGMDGRCRAVPGELVAILKPVAFRRTDLERGFAALERIAPEGLVPDVSVAELLAHAGQGVAFVPGYTMNFKLTTFDDLELAQRIAAQD